jgi:hypothetical protein
MKYSVWFIGALICALGVAAMIKPHSMKRVVEFLALGRRFWMAAAVRGAVGVIFLVFARDCRMPWLIILIGILMAGSSLLVMTLEPVKVQKLMQFIQNRPLWLFRCWGIAAVIFGGLILYAG